MVPYPSPHHKGANHRKCKNPESCIIPLICVSDGLTRAIERHVSCVQKQQPVGTAHLPPLCGRLLQRVRDTLRSVQTPLPSRMQPSCRPCSPRSPLTANRCGAAWRYKREPQTAESIYDSLFDELNLPAAAGLAQITPREDAEAGLVRRMLAVRRRPWDLQASRPRPRIRVRRPGPSLHCRQRACEEAAASAY